MGIKNAIRSNPAERVHDDLAGLKKRAKQLEAEYQRINARIDELLGRAAEQDKPEDKPED